MYGDALNLGGSASLVAAQIRGEAEYFPSDRFDPRTASYFFLLPTLSILL
jgi:hypothetical protein